jgi:hypothetical protein
LQLLHILCSQAAAYFPDFDTARQTASAFQVVYLEWSSREGAKHANDGRIRELLENLDRELDLWSVTGADSSRDTRKRLIRDQVEKAAAKKPATEKAFQETLRDLTKEKLNAALLDTNLLAGLQSVRDKDLEESSQAAGNYDPILFKSRLMELSKLLPHE